MRFRRSLIVLALAAFASTAQAQRAQQQLDGPEFEPLPGGGQVYTVDRTHSILDFTVRLVGFNRTRGHFNAWSADFVYDPAQPAKTTIAFIADATTIDTDNRQRDADLRGETFFNVAAFPRLRFRSTRVSPAANGFMVEGVLTIRDSSRTVRFPMTVIDPMGRDPFGNWRIAFGGEVTINRRDFGVIGPAFWNNAISDSVKIEMEMAGRVWDYFHLGFGQNRPSIGGLLYAAADSNRLAAGITRARALIASPTDTVNASAFQLETAAMRRVQQRRLDDARQILEFAREVHRAGPERAQILARLGEIYLRMNRRNDAATSLRDAVAADPDNTLAAALLATIS